MKTFKQWLRDGAYDLGLQEHLYVKESAWGKNFMVDVFDLVEAYVKDETADMRKTILDLKRGVDFLDDGYNDYKQLMK